MATARPPVARLSAANLERFGTTVTVTGDRGSITVPAEVADIADDVVWLPANSTGRGLLADLAGPGIWVRVEGAGVSTCSTGGGDSTGGDGSTGAGPISEEDV